jgi:hypothetical protein
MRIAYNKDGSQKIPGVSFAPNIATLRLKSISESQWTQVVKNPAAFQSAPLFRDLADE